MSKPWFRFYADALDDPKVQRLDGEAFKVWVNCLCLACRGDGMLPPIADIAFGLRMSESGTTDAIRGLQDVGLLDETAAGLIPHNWAGRQHQSDSSAERTRRYREQKRHSDGGPKRHRDVAVTPQNRTDTEQSRERTESPPHGCQIPEELEAAFHRLVEAYPNAAGG